MRILVGALVAFLVLSVAFLSTHRINPSRQAILGALHGVPGNATGSADAPAGELSDPENWKVRALTVRKFRGR